MPATTEQRAAAYALTAHDALLATYTVEPDSDTAPRAWLLWRSEDYEPAYSDWSAAMDALATTLNDPAMSRHPHNFRPRCEEILTA